MILIIFEPHCPPAEQKAIFQEVHILWVVWESEYCTSRAVLLTQLELNAVFFGIEMIEDILFFHLKNLIGFVLIVVALNEW